MAAFFVGALVLINQGLALDERIGLLLPVFYHLLMVGWATQLICGVALWLNIGVVLAALHDPLALAAGETIDLLRAMIGYYTRVVSVG